MKKYHETFLLLTACVNPNDNTYFLLLKDPKIREKNYLSALEFYIRNSKYRNIVFCDNSNYCVDDYFYDLAKKYRVNLECLCYFGNQEKLIENGKGYGDCEIINYVLDNSEIAKKCNSFIKISGRYIIKNVNSILPRKYKKDLYYVMLYRKKKTDNLRNMTLVDTRIISMRVDFYKMFVRNRIMDICDEKGYYMESLFRDTIKERLANCENFVAYPNYDKIIEGSSGKKVSVNMVEKYKRIIALYLGMYKYSKE